MFSGGLRDQGHLPEKNSGDFHPGFRTGFLLPGPRKSSKYFSQKVSQSCYRKSFESRISLFVKLRVVISSLDLVNIESLFR